MRLERQGVRHSEVYRRKGQFAGWPANYGLWMWGNETVVVFVAGILGSEGPLHACDRNHAFRPRQARSLDGGLTWAIEAFSGATPGGASLSADEHLNDPLRAGTNIAPGRELLILDSPIDFFDPETIVMAARTGIRGNAISWFYVSRDRARTWAGPFALGDMGLPGISARTDIVALGRHDALFMLTSTKSDGEEGRVFCARTEDGGRSFYVQAFLMAETAGYSIMPASVMRPDGAILTLVRRMETTDTGWIGAFISKDLGQSWREIGEPIPTGYGGNPPAVTTLADGRIVLVYGYRDRPYGIRCRTSRDGGVTWSAETIVRDDGGSPDLGYARIVVRRDGSILAVYYFNSRENPERFIAASTFSADAVTWRAHPRL